MKIHIEPHNPLWDQEFQRIRTQLLEILAGIPLISIEHVGSTSIPDLWAKPVLDIDIIIKPENLAQTRIHLEKAGYMDLGELGVEGRFVFRQPGFGRWETADGVIREDSDGERRGMRRNTNVAIEGCLALRNHLDVKKALLEDKEAREEYSRVKLELVEKDWESVDDYCRGRMKFCLGF